MSLYSRVMPDSGGDEFLSSMNSGLASVKVAFSDFLKMKEAYT